MSETLEKLREILSFGESLRSNYYRNGDTIGFLVNSDNWAEVVQAWLRENPHVALNTWAAIAEVVPPPMTPEDAFYWRKLAMAALLDLLNAHSQRVD